MRLYGDIEERCLVRLAFTDFCWEWTGYRDADGYGRVRIGGEDLFVHRAVMEWKLGRRLMRAEIIDHLCRNRPCARPSHLEVVTPSENTRRGWAARLSTEAAQRLRLRRSEGLTYVELSREFGIHYTTAIRICRGKAIGDLFDRKETP